MTITYNVRDKIEKRTLPIIQAKWKAKDMLEAKGCHPKASLMLSATLDELVSDVESGKYAEVEIGVLLETFERRIEEFAHYVFDDIKQYNYFAPRLINGFMPAYEKCVINK